MPQLPTTSVTAIPLFPSPLRHEPQLRIRAIARLQLGGVPCLRIGETPGLALDGKVDPEQCEAIFATLQRVNCGAVKQQKSGAAVGLEALLIAE
jgi:hypothetical protein